MPATAKIFMTGSSQAVRLPKQFRIDASEVWVSRNDATGEVTLQPKPKPDDLDGFFALLGAAPVGSDDFVPARNDSPAEDPLANWEVSSAGQK